MNKPNFLIVGAPKAGTTSLYHYLSEHPEVFMTNPKEVNFFSGEEIEKQGLYYKDFKIKSLDEYLDLFKDAKNKKAIGEGSVSYLFYPKTPLKIKELLPNVKIIILLRNPLDRGYSHYLMDNRLGLVDLSYDEIVYQRSEHKLLDLYYQQYIALGFYYEQVKRYIDIFGKEKIKIYFQEDLMNQRDRIINNLYDFLDIDKKVSIDFDKKYNTFFIPKNKFLENIYQIHSLRTTLSKILPLGLKDYILNNFFQKDKKPVLEKEVKNYLLSLYKPDIQKLESLLDRDLSHWYK